MNTLVRTTILFSVSAAIACGAEKEEPTPSPAANTLTECVETARALGADEVTPLGFSFDRLEPSIVGQSDATATKLATSSSTSLAVEVRFSRRALSFVQSMRNPKYLLNGGRICRDFVRADMDVVLRAADGSIDGTWVGAATIHGPNEIRISAEFMVTPRPTPSNFPDTPGSVGTFHVDEVDIAGKEGRIRLLVAPRGRAGSAFLDVSSRDATAAAFNSTEFVRWSSAP